MTEFILRYWVQVGFGLVVAFISFSCKWLVVNPIKAEKARHEKEAKEQELLKMGVQALLRDRIVQAYNHYYEKGYCPIYARENIQALYLQYHNLGGNGTITTLVEKLKGLPTKEEEK